MLTLHSRLLIVLKHNNPQRIQIINKVAHTGVFCIVKCSNEEQHKAVIFGFKNIVFCPHKSTYFYKGPVINCSSFPTAVLINGGGLCEWFRCRSVEASFPGCDAASLGDTRRPMTRRLSSLRWLMQLNYDIQRRCDRPLRHKFSWFSSALIKNFGWFHNLKLTLYTSHEAPQI
jgi:hypothetical protein